jgi:DNA processing protein
MERRDLEAWLRLRATAGVGNATARRLLSAFGLPEKVFAQSHASLLNVVNTSVASALLGHPTGLDAQVDATWDWLAEEPARRRILTLGDPLYPQSLLDIEDPPLLLYAIASPQLWDGSGIGTVFARTATHRLAIVGSRNPTPQGLANAREFSRALAQAGLTIVSGLALGVDGAAHEGALASDAAPVPATIAVVGTGLDRVYPRQHRDLSHRISERGLLLSEYPLGTAPSAANFPQRNRIISGLCAATLVVEATLESGSLITARLASEQGKDVFAIPGSIHSPQSRGCHALIKQGAKLIECAQDILEELVPGTTFNPATSAGNGKDKRQSPPDGLLALLGHDPVTLDALCERTGWNTARLQADLMALELAGDVRRLPGGLFQRLVLA